MCAAHAIPTPCQFPKGILSTPDSDHLRQFLPFACAGHTKSHAFGNGGGPVPGLGPPRHGGQTPRPRWTPTGRPATLIRT